MNVSYSRMYGAIAKIAEHLEDHLNPEEFVFLDGGLTLQIDADAIAQVSKSSLWQELVQNFEQAGGCIYSPDFFAIA